MKVTFNKNLVRNSPWGGGNQMLGVLVKHLEKEGIDVSFSLDTDTDVVVIMDSKEASCTFSMKELADFKKKNGIRVVHRVNDNGKHRALDQSRNDNIMIEVNKIADETIFISHWLKDYFENQGMNTEGSTIIDNGVDRDLFGPAKNEFVRSPDDPIKIITHHWSDNMAKGYELYNDLDQFCIRNPKIAQFTFMGRHPDHYLRTCRKISPKPYLEIPPYLQGQDVYVTATLYESGGCHIVEGMGCGLIPIVRKGSGGPEEYSRPYSLLFNTSDELIQRVIELYDDYDKFLEMRRKIREDYTYGSEDMFNEYKKVILG